MRIHEFAGLASGKCRKSRTFGTCPCTRKRREKMKFLKIFVLMMVLQGLFTTCGFGEIYCKIKGRVIDGDTGEGIPDVNVNLHRFLHDSPREYFVLTDDKGNFTFSNLRAGNYCLNYFPLYPYACIPAEKANCVSYDRAFQVNEGEIKNVIQPLEKGGEIIFNYHSPYANIDEEYTKNSGYIHIVVNDKLFEASLVTRFVNPKFIGSKECIKVTGLAAGQYIISRSYEKLPEYYSENNVDFVGVIKRFTLEKLEQKKLDVEYNSKSKIIINLKGQDNMTFVEGGMKIFKRIMIDDTEVYHAVWLKRLKPNAIVNPIIIAPGEYVISFDYGNLKNKDGNEVKFDSNDFLVNIKENQTNEMNCLILVNGRKLFDSGIFIH